MADKQTILIEVQAKTDQVDKLKKSILELRKANKTLRDAQKQLDKDFKAGLIDLETYEAATTDLTNALEQNKEETAKQNKELKQVNRELQLNNKVATSAAGSLEQLRAESALLTREFEKLSAEERDNSEAGKKLKKRLSEINEEIADLKIETKDGTDLFSRYTVGINNAIPALGGFDDVVENLKIGFGGLGKSLKSGITLLKLFKVALAATGIGLLITALSAVVGFLTKTEKGTRALSSALAQIGAVIDTVAGSLFKIGEGIVDFIKGDRSKGIDKIANSFDNLGDRISENVEAAKNLAQNTQFLEVLQRKTEKTVAKLNSVAEIQSAIADDATRGFAERQFAAANAEKAANKAAQAELKLAKERLKLANELKWLGIKKT